MTYTAKQDGASAVVVGPDGSIELRHFPQPDSASALRAAEDRAATLNRRRTPAPGVFDLRKQLGRAPTAAEYRAARGR
jgi:hypothetical protein